MSKFLCVYDKNYRKKICLEISWGMVNREMGFEEAPTVTCPLKLT